MFQFVAWLELGRGLEHKNLIASFCAENDRMAWENAELAVAMFEPGEEWERRVVQVWEVAREVPYPSEEHPM